MGRSYTPTYRIEFWEHPQGQKIQQAWSTWAYMYAKENES